MSKIYEYRITYIRQNTPYGVKPEKVLKVAHCEPKNIENAIAFLRPVGYEYDGFRRSVFALPELEWRVTYATPDGEEYQDSFTAIEPWAYDVACENAPDGMFVAGLAEM